MVNDVIGSSHKIHWDLLQDRFPDIAFSLTVAEVEPLPQIQDVEGRCNAKGPRGPLYTGDIEQEIEAWKRSIPLEGIDVLYVYGIGLGYYYSALQQWLQEKKERTLVFLEDDLQVLATVCALPEGLQILQDPKVHIKYIGQTPHWERIVEEAIRQFLSDHVDFTALASYRLGKEKKIARIRLLFLRKSALMTVAVTELLHYDRLMENISANMALISQASHVNAWQGICQGIPAIICGAGVSLREAIPYLQEIENKAIIFAGGSAITALYHFGIRPHITVALDPNEEEYLRIKASGSFELPFMYASRLHKNILSSTNVRAAYVCSDTGGAFENWMHEQLAIPPGSLGEQLGQEALSVTTLAAPLAQHLGCDPILFCGVDLSYKNMQRYPPGVVASARVFLEELRQERRSMEKLVRKKNGEGQFVYSLVKWVMEASCLGSYAKKYSGGRFFAASKEGLPIASITYMSLEDFTHQFCGKEYDLRGRLHAAIEETSLSWISEEKIAEAFSTLTHSLDTCACIVQDLLTEIERKHAVAFVEGMSWQSGKMQLLEMDLAQEIAYEVCLSSILAMYRKILERRYPSFLYTEEEKKYLEELSKQKRIWQECLVVIQTCKSALQKGK